MDESIFFAEEPTQDQSSSSKKQPWHILVVDDHSDVYFATKDALSHQYFFGRPLEFLNAGSAEQAKVVLAEHPEIAVVLLDVRMETPDAGLRFVGAVREELKNPYVRIILRTGYAKEGSADKIVLDYDIDGYIDKTEGGAERLISSIAISLRFYRSLIYLAHHNKSLRIINQLYDTILPDQDPLDPHQSYSDRIMRQFEEVWCVGAEANIKHSGFLALLPGERIIQQIPAEAVFANFNHDTRQSGAINILSALGSYENHEELFTLPPSVIEALQQACDQKKSILGPNHSVIYVANRHADFALDASARMLYYLEDFPPIEPESEVESFLEMFTSTIFRIYHQVWGIE